VVYTDVLQEILFFSVSIYFGYQAFTMPEHSEILSFAGQEWSSFVPQWTAEPMTWLSDPAVYHLFGICILFWIARGVLEGAGGFTGGYMTQRYFATRSSREAGLMTAEWILLLLFRWALIIGIALVALSLARQAGPIAMALQHDAEKALPLVLGNAVPAGLRGLMVAALVAAAMSTFDSTVNAGASYWVKDIYQRFFRPQATSKQLVRQSRISTMVLALVGFAVALGVHNIDEIWSWITGPLAAGLFAPIILRWYWWRFNGYGFAISTATGLAVSIVLKLAWPQVPLYVGFPVTWSIALVAGIAGSLMTPATADEVLERFFLQIRPFGFWNPIRRTLREQGERLEPVRRENRRDLVSVFLAIGWHLSGVVSVISLLLHKWTTLTVAVATFASLSVILYFTWYRHLGEADEGRS
jgi:Na+/proline symporter